MESSNGVTLQLTRCHGSTKHTRNVLTCTATDGGVLVTYKDERDGLVYEKIECNWARWYPRKDAQ